MQEPEPVACGWEYATIRAEGEIRDGGWSEGTVITTFWIFF